VELRTATVVLLAGLAVCSASALVPSNAAGGLPITIQILFDLADGSYVWAYENVVDPSAVNATWHAVQAAASANGITLSFAWYSCCGVAILDVGARHPPAGFVGLLQWNFTAHAWDFTRVGISSLVLRAGDVIALYNAAFASVPPYASRTPVPTPDDPFPALGFRSDLLNSGVARSAAPDNPRVFWDRDTGSREIGSTPAVAFGKVFVETMGGMFALDAATGGTVWQNVRAKGFSSPSVFNNSVYVGTSNGTVMRMNATMGTTIWETRLLAKTSFSGITSSPKVAFDWVFVGTFNETGGPGDVVALYEGNGTVAWRHPTGSIHFSSPAFANGTVYVGVMGFYNTTTQVSFNPPYGVLALDAATGGTRWFFPTRGSVAASPAIVGSNLVVPSKDGSVYALDRATGNQVWEARVDAGISSAAVASGTIFVGGGAFGSAGKVTALDAASGSTKWSFAANGPVQSSITYAAGTIVFATNAANGTVYALDATTGILSWSFEPTPAEYILGSPVVADGLVFVLSDNGHVYALGRSPFNRLPGVMLGVVDLTVVFVIVLGLGLVVWLVRRRRPRDGA
jgi:outer membrane protein assembly factor BamB